jgi:hypothetical protein
VDARGEGGGELAELKLKGGEREAVGGAAVDGKREAVVVALRVDAKRKRDGAGADELNEELEDGFDGVDVAQVAGPDEGAVGGPAAASEGA